MSRQIPIADPVDIHVGGRIKERRVALGKSQTELGNALGLTFQQVQKYERGSNRISASKLFQTANFLGVSPAYFFEGFGEGNGADVSPNEMNRKTLTLVRLFLDAPDNVQEGVLQMLRAVQVDEPANQDADELSAA